MHIAAVSNNERSNKETASVQQCWYFNKTSEAIICIIIPGTVTDGHTYQCELGQLPRMCMGCPLGLLARSKVVH